eukprot:gene18937-26809_t
MPALLAAGLLPAGTAIAFPVPFRMALALDQPGAILLGGAALLWSAAGAYAASYLRGKPGLTAFSVWWLLTLAGSLGVLIVADIAGFYLLFTLASLSAYGLVAHEQTDAARRAGLVYMVLALLGEAFLLFAFVMLAAGQPDPNPLIRDAVAALPGSPMRDGIVSLLMLGFALKMGLIPLHVWLPDSMEGPTPISALIHAATMVTAGIFMVARMSPLFELSDVALNFIMVIGAITALFMGFLGIIQNDIKRVVAYSTLSQLGYMTVALGASAYSVAVFHLMTHAFFKALLFLAAGSVIIGMHHDQDIRNMGGLRKYMPITWITSLLGSLALIGT